MNGDEPSIKVIFDWVWQHISTGKFRHGSRVTVPPEYAGWVKARHGDPWQEEDGCVPLGAVIDRLVQLVARSDLTRQTRVVLQARVGLTEYPTGRGQRPLGQRVPRERGGRQGGLSDRHLRGLHRKAIEGLATRDLRDPLGRKPVFARPVPDPAVAPWFTRHVPVDDRYAMLVRAIEAARVFLAVSGVDDDLEHVHRDIDDYERRLRRQDWPPTRPVGRSRAHAVVGIALWNLLRARTEEERAEVGAEVALRSGRLDPPMEFVTAVASKALGLVVAGSADPEIVLMACDDTLRCEAFDHPQARVMADLLLGCYATNRGQLGQAAKATILRTVVRVRSIDDDPTVFGLLRRLVRQFPNCWQTVDAMQVGIQVASGHSLLTRAEELHREVAAALRDGITVGDDRCEPVETVEFELWNLYQRVGAYRRRLDEGPPDSPWLLQRSLRFVDEMWLAYRNVLQLNESEDRKGDASPAWEFYLLVRSAEVHLVAALLEPGGQHPDLARKGIVLAQRRLADCALDAQPVARALLTKVQLREALYNDDPDSACGYAAKLGLAGWPMARTPLFARGFELSQPSSTLQDIVTHYLQQERAGTPTIVDGRTRRRFVVP